MTSKQKVQEPGILPIGIESYYFATFMGGRLKALRTAVYIGHAMKEADEFKSWV